MIRCDQYTLTATAVTITSALGLPEPMYCKNIDISAKTGNAASFYLGGPAVTNTPTHAGYEITTTRSFWSGPLMQNTVSTDDLYIVGTASDVAYIAIMV